MNLLSFLCSSSSAATALKADADAGNLWGVDLGTTSRSEVVGNRLVVCCTEPRGASLFAAADVQGEIAALDCPAPSEMGSQSAMFYALGKMDA